MGNTFRQKDKVSNFRKSIRILEHFFAGFLVLIGSVASSLVFVVGISMKEGQESFVLMGIPFCIGLWALFIFLYKRWQLAWDWPDGGGV